MPFRIIGEDCTAADTVALSLAVLVFIAVAVAWGARAVVYHELKGIHSKVQVSSPRPESALKMNNVNNGIIGNSRRLRVLFRPRAHLLFAGSYLFVCGNVPEIAWMHT